MIKILLLSLISYSNLSFPQSKKLIFTEYQLNQSFDEKTLLTSIKELSDTKKYQIETSGLKIIAKQKSLLGTHYKYAQEINGIEIEGANLIVSVDKENKIFKIYNTTKSKSSLKSLRHQPSIPFFNKAQAVRVAWNHLKVNGELLSRPLVKMSYQTFLENRLVYEVNLNTTSPYGNWLVTIDANNARILRVQDAAINKRKHQNSIKSRLLGNRKVRDYKSAYNKIINTERNTFRKIRFNPNMVVRRSLWTNIFDPNPVVTLMSTSLEDSDAPEVFEEAYFRSPILGISLKNQKYELIGKRITLYDFDSPREPITTSEDGIWDVKRGEAGFNDVMTYVHLDKNIRYIESLGYVKEKRVFKKSLQVDSNGANGRDNSYYQPYTKRLSFGHGCVDDNEDTDVILHELGHAINDHINPQWKGGDTGAMGEGFGDYWAASYSASRENGLEVKPNWVFKWDGHNKCWAGRVLNKLRIKYVHSRTYGAHQSIQGGISDELWSTPIFQAFLELYKNGVARKTIDRIIIEAQFGLGSRLKMRDMAKSIIKTAKLLYPNKKYDEVYIRNFKRHQIIE